MFRISVLVNDGMSPNNFHLRIQSVVFCTSAFILLLMSSVKSLLNAHVSFPLEPLMLKLQQNLDHVWQMRWWLWLLSCCFYFPSTPDFDSCFSLVLWVSFQNCNIFFSLLHVLVNCSLSVCPLSLCSWSLLLRVDACVLENILVIIFFRHPQAMCTSVYIFHKKTTTTNLFLSVPLMTFNLMLTEEVQGLDVPSSQQETGLLDKRWNVTRVQLPPSNSAKETFRSQVSNVLHCCIYSTWLKNGFTINISTVRLTAKLPPSLWDGSGVFNCLALSSSHVLFMLAGS